MAGCAHLALAYTAERTAWLASNRSWLLNVNHVELNVQVGDSDDRRFLLFLVTNKSLARVVALRETVLHRVLR